MNSRTRAFWYLVVAYLAIPVGAQTEPPADPQAIIGLIESGQLESAEQQLRQTIAIADNPAAHHLLGIVLSRSGQHGAAEQQFRAAIEMAPELLPPHQALARLLLQQGRTDEALDGLRTAAKIGPLDRRLALWLADAELARSNPAAAEVQLRSVVDRFESVSALLQLARLEARAGDNGAAMELLERALERAPNSEELLEARAKLALARATPLVAIDALEALTRMHPEVARHAYLLGVARLQIADLDGATEALQQSLELAPRRPLPLLALGKTLTAQKRFEAAREALGQSLQLDPENAETLAVLAEAAEGLGELGQAEEYANRALARHPSHPGALLTVGLIRMKEERYEAARDAFLESIASGSDQAKVHYQLSLAFARLGDRDSSAHHLERYRQLRRAKEDQLIELRTETGTGTAGMGAS